MEESVDRRSFLAQTSTTAAAALVAAQSVGAQSSRSSQSPGAGMYIVLRYAANWNRLPGVALLAPPAPGTAPGAQAGEQGAASGGGQGGRGGGVQGTMSWQEQAQLAAKLGYGGVDVTLDTTTVSAGPDKARQLLTDLKLRSGFFNMPVNIFNRDEAQFQESFKRLDEVCAFAAAMDCPRAMTILFPTSDLPKTEQWKISRDRAQQMQPVLAKHKVRIGIEFLGPAYFRYQQKYEFIHRMPETLEFSKECGPNFGLVLDSFQWHYAEGTIQDILDAGSRIVFCHLADAKASPGDVNDRARAQVGEGYIDWNRFFQALATIGFDGELSLEPTGVFAAGTTPEAAAKASLDATLAAMKKAGLPRP
jgi:sugar phosphate isomerase/epimerase